MLTYKEWLLQFKEIDLPIGDMATAIELDAHFPNTNDYESIQEYVKTNPTLHGFIRVFEYSFKMFCESTQKKI
ncbi:YozE family protein [Bacillus cereus]|uniref:YozE SAM-like domain-containing protein n=2 Tax=Bacillus cereus group TaxID=86661 RepID=A0A9W5KXF3_BACCE|nr:MULTISPECIES: YozE family protein [Bacillus cereus group]MEB8731242.1 YozE family protein [Bacillus cereus]EJR72002.1 hypothetical protein IK5_02900 [Bacillus cereus VD154]KIU70636.1 hypothetical protein C797_27608 [Bacillus thuringiensis Sbt003]MBG9511299.1 hypothetical protein [Bacillus thuringiensis]MEB8752258.1 YozE family protein [Bacillus cereus]